MTKLEEAIMKNRGELTTEPPKTSKREAFLELLAELEAGVRALSLGGIARSRLTGPLAGVRRAVDLVWPRVEPPSEEPPPDSYEERSCATCGRHWRVEPRSLVAAVCGVCTPLRII